MYVKRKAAGDLVRFPRAVFQLIVPAKANGVWRIHSDRSYGRGASPGRMAGTTAFRGAWSKLPH